MQVIILHHWQSMESWNTSHYSSIFITDSPGVLGCRSLFFITDSPGVLGSRPLFFITGSPGVLGCKSLFCITGSPRIRSLFIITDSPSCSPYYCHYSSSTVVLEWEKSSQCNVLRYQIIYDNFLSLRSEEFGNFSSILSVAKKIA